VLRSRRQARRTLTEDLKRVVASIGGTPAARAPGDDAPVTHRPGFEGAVASQSGRERGFLDPGGLGGVAALHPEAPPMAEVSAIERPLSTRAALSDAVSVAPPVQRVPALSAPAARGGRPAEELGAPAARGERVSVPGPTHATTTLDVDAGDVQRPRDLDDEAVGHAVPVLARPGARKYRTLPRACHLVRRSRTPAASLPKKRLATMWATLLREHPLPPEEVAFVGVYGPFPMDLVVGARVGPDARIIVEMRRKVVKGKLGDILLAVHTPTGKLLRSMYPR